MVSYVGDIKKAITGAERELDSLNEKIKELETIRLRMMQIETFLKAARAVVGVTDQLSENSLTQVASEMFTGTDKTITIIEKPHLVGIAEILKEVNKPLSLSDLAEEFRKRNWKISEKNGRQVLRAAILRRPDMFNRTIQGITAYYALKQDGESGTTAESPPVLRRRINRTSAI